MKCLATARLAAIAAYSSAPIAFGETLINPVADVMTSAFFQGPNQVRGYAGDVRPVFRVSSDLAFGVGPETIYIGFDPNDFGAFGGGPVESASLSLVSTDGNFGANAGPNDPFIVSAHAVNADPFTAIIDDTNPTGLVTAPNFFNNNILAAAPEALTTINGFGTVSFDVTSIFNDWLSGSNTFYAIAVTAKNDPQTGNGGGGYLHGFVNNTETPGSTFITVVPEPASLLLLGAGMGLTVLRRRR